MAILMKPISYSSKFLDDFDEDSCSICLSIGLDTITACNHVFHYTCLQQWMEQKPNQTCPMCKQNAQPIQNIIQKPKITFNGIKINYPMSMTGIKQTLTLIPFQQTCDILLKKVNGGGGIPDLPIKVRGTILC